MSQPAFGGILADLTDDIRRYLGAKGEQPMTDNDPPHLTGFRFPLGAVLTRKDCLLAYEQAATEREWQSLPKYRVLRQVLETDKSGTRQLYLCEIVGKQRDGERLIESAITLLPPHPLLAVLRERFPVEAAAIDVLDVGGAVNLAIEILGRQPATVPVAEPVLRFFGEAQVCPTQAPPKFWAYKVSTYPDQPRREQMSKQEQTNPPMAVPGLTEGRIVHFVPPPTLSSGFSGDHIAAIVVKVWDRAAGTVNLRLFLDGSNSHPNYFSDIGSRLEWATSVVYDPTGEAPRSWHFPERVD